MTIEGRSKDNRRTTGFLLKIYRTFKQTMIEPYIWGSLEEVEFEFEFDTSTERDRIRFDEEKLRKAPASQEIWSLDFPLEKMSAGHRSAKFGWMNKPE
jgi:hypothetical protein